MTTLRLVLVLVFLSLPLVAERAVELRARSSHHYDARALPERLGEHRLIRVERLHGEAVEEHHQTQRADERRRLRGWRHRAKEQAREQHGADAEARADPEQPAARVEVAVVAADVGEQPAQAVAMSPPAVTHAATFS